MGRAPGPTQAMTGHVLSAQRGRTQLTAILMVENHQIQEFTSKPQSEYFLHAMTRAQRFCLSIWVFMGKVPLQVEDGLVKRDDKQRFLAVGVPICNTFLV